MKIQDYIRINYCIAKCWSGELSPKTTSLFMGHELTDEESTIIHHFSSSELRYIFKLQSWHIVEKYAIKLNLMDL